MNTPLVGDTTSRSHLSENIPSQDRVLPLQVRAIIRSGHTILLETGISFESMPILGQAFDTGRLSPAERTLLGRFSREGYLYKIGCGRDGVPEVEIAVEPAMSPASRPQVKLNAARIPHNRRGPITAYLKRQLGSLSVTWEPVHAGPFVIERDPSACAPPADTLEEGIRALIACPMGAG